MQVTGLELPHQNSCVLHHLEVDMQYLNSAGKNINKSASVLQAIARAYKGLQGSKWLGNGPCKPL